MQRFFRPPADFIGDEVIIRDPGFAHRLRHVLRMRPGDEVIFLDGSGIEHQVLLRQMEAECIVGEVLSRRICPTEPHIKVALYQALLKGERFEWLLQKATEVGVSEFVPLLSERCIVLDVRQVSEQKVRRWERIIQQAAEQSRRGRLPPLQPLILLGTACEQVQRAGGVALMPWEKAERPLRQVLEERERPFKVAILIGPEGGFSPVEVETAERYGIVPVSLGPRILRAETAGMVAAALVLYHYGEMSP